MANVIQETADFLNATIREYHELDCELRRLAEKAQLPRHLTALCRYTAQCAIRDIGNRAGSVEKLTLFTAGNYNWSQDRITGGSVKAWLADQLKQEAGND